MIALFVAALAAAAPPAVVRADPLPAVVHVKFQNDNGTGLREPTGPAEQELAAELARRLSLDSEALFDRTPGWDCLSVRQRSRWVVEVGVVVSTAPGATGPASASAVNASVSVVGSTENNVAAVPRAPLPAGATIGSIEFEAAAQIDRAVGELQRRGIKPCEPKAKIKGKRTVTQEGGRINYDWEGQESLRLGNDGAFEAGLPVRMRVSASIADCTITGAVDIRLSVAGSYREGGGLVFTRMDSPRIPSTVTQRCPRDPDRSIPIQPWWGGGSWLGRPEVGLPLENGASVSLRPEWLVAEPGAGEMTLELEYGLSGGRPVAGASRD